MRPVASAAEMRAIDRATIDERGVPGAVLMENAGRAVADAVIGELVAGARPPVAVVAGVGNNGGDGAVVARHLREHSVEVAFYLVGRADAVAGDARAKLDALAAAGVPIVELADGAALAAYREAISHAGVVVDALFGTGLGREVVGVQREAIEAINLSRGRIVAVDLPSGLDADRGIPLGVAVRPHRTIALGHLKPALVSAPGFASVGEVELAPIGIPADLAAGRAVRLALLEAGDAAPLVPRRDPLGHKYAAGHLLVVAGSPGKRGAGRLAAWAAMRGGAGLVTLAAAGDEIAAPDPVMTATLDADARGAPERLAALAAGKRALAIGPGMATSAGGRALVDAALALELPVVLDADALGHLVGDVGRVARARARAILTPHTGEAARLLEVGREAVEGDRIGAARRLAALTGSVVVLKGARTLVVDGGGHGFTTINPTGNPGLGTAGTGDILTGLVGALCAQGLAPIDAARLGVWLHGAAGDQARDQLGELGMTATDVAEALPSAFRALG
jgi:NAD(P)H-hydrate epimerase